MKTIVIFRKFPASDGGGVIALFPTIAADMRGNLLSYMHTGQHGAASPDLGRNLRLANPGEYAPLARELESLGYTLDIRTRSCPAYARAHRESLFPIATLGDKDHAAKRAETVRRLTSRPTWKLADCDYSPAR